MSRSPLLVFQVACTKTVAYTRADLTSSVANKRLMRTFHRKGRKVRSRTRLMFGVSF